MKNGREVIVSTEGGQNTPYHTAYRLLKLRHPTIAQNPITQLQKALQQDFSGPRQITGQLSNQALFNIGLPNHRESYFTQQLSLPWDDHTTLKLETPFRRVLIDADIKGDDEVALRFSVYINDDKLRAVTGAKTRLATQADIRAAETPFYTWRQSIISADVLASIIDATYDAESDFYTKRGDINLHYSPENNELQAVIPKDIPAAKVVLHNYFREPRDSSKPSYSYLIIRNYHPTLGWVREIVPARPSGNNLIFYVQKFEHSAQIVDYIEFNDNNLVAAAEVSPIGNIRFIKEGVSDYAKDGYPILPEVRTERILAGPMVRISDPAFGYLMQKLFGIPYISEMVAGSLLFSAPEDVFAQATFGINGLSGFNRISIPESQLSQACIQLAVSNPIEGYGSYTSELSDMQNGSQDKILASVKRTGTLLKKMGVKHVNLNFCCPAQAILDCGGGIAGLEDMDLSTHIIKELKRLGLKVSAKIVFVPDESGVRIDREKTKNIARRLETAGLDELYIQSQLPGIDIFDHSLTDEIASELKIPVFTNGGISTLTEVDSRNLPNPDTYDSAQEVLNNHPHISGVMLGRALLGGSIWTFLGITPSEGQVLALAQLETKLLQEAYYGMHEVATVFAKIRAMYHLNVIPKDSLRTRMITKVQTASSIDGITRILEEEAQKTGISIQEVSDQLREKFMEKTRLLNLRD